MGTCATCHNDYDRMYRVITPDGEELDFDSIECAVSRITPRCAHCGTTLLGHVGLDGDDCCSAHCAGMRAAAPTPA